MLEIFNYCSQISDINIYLEKWYQVRSIQEQLVYNVITSVYIKPLTIGSVVAYWYWDEDFIRQHPCSCPLKAFPPNLHLFLLGEAESPPAPLEETHMFNFQYYLIRVYFLETTNDKIAILGIIRFTYSSKKNFGLPRSSCPQNSSLSKENNNSIYMTE